MNYFITILFLFPFLTFVFSHFYSIKRLKRIKKKEFRVSHGYRLADKVEDYNKKKAEDIVFLIEEIKKDILGEFTTSNDPEERYQKTMNRKRYEREKEKAYWEKKRKEWFE